MEMNKGQGICCVVLVALLSPGLGCRSAADDALGEWELWSVDGELLEDAPPTIQLVPGMSVGDIETQDGDSWIERKVLASRVQIFSDGYFAHERIAETTYVFAPESPRAMGGIASRQWPLRDYRGVDTVRTLGQWSVEGGSIQLLGDTAVVARRLVNVFQRMNPQVPDEQALAHVLSVMEEMGLPVPLLVVTVSGERLVGVNIDGRQVVYRRPAMMWPN